MIISPERLDPFADGKFCSFFVLITPSPFPPPFTVHFFATPMTTNGFHTCSFAVQPFDHNTIACFPDPMPSPWSILCGPTTFCVIVCFLPNTRSAFLSNFAAHVSVGSKYYHHDFKVPNGTLYPGVCNKIKSNHGRVTMLFCGEVVRCSMCKGAGAIHLTDMGGRWIVCESKG